jgi:hypothetical protein
MRLHQVVVVVMGFLIAGPTWFLMSMLTNGMSSGRWDRSILLLPGFLLLLVVMMALGFVSESRRALHVLTAIVEGESTRRDE